MGTRFRPFVKHELAAARAARGNGDAATAFAYLERAHILSQYATSDHVRVHFEMLLWGLWQRDLREILGQLLRIVGALTKTAIGWIPRGNTGGSNVSPFKPMQVPPDLEAILSVRGD